MSDPSAVTLPSRLKVPTDASTHFAWIRTRLSLERTMMSWMHTAVAMIGFGFTIVQFSEAVRPKAEVALAHISSSPRYLGLGLIFCGVLALATSVWQYHWSLRYLWNEDFSAFADANNERNPTPLYALAIVLILIGTAAFVDVMFHILEPARRCLSRPCREIQQPSSR